LRAAAVRYVSVDPGSGAAESTDGHGRRGWERTAGGNANTAPVGQPHSAWWRGGRELRHEVARGECCDTRSHVVSVLVKEVWLMPET
jgi:hypothetical protein